jgi:hypothetical protein
MYEGLGDAPPAVKFIVLAPGTSAEPARLVVRVINKSPVLRKLKAPGVPSGKDPNPVVSA